MTNHNYMNDVREALKAGKRVEIHRHSGFSSGSLQAARESAQDAADANSRGERVVRVIDSNGEREIECGADAAEVRELLAAGAVEVE